MSTYNHYFYNPSTTYSIDFSYSDTNQIKVKRKNLNDILFHLDGNSIVFEEQLSENEEFYIIRETPIEGFDFINNNLTKYNIERLKDNLQSNIIEAKDRADTYIESLNNLDYYTKNDTDILLSSLNSTLLSNVDNKLVNYYDINHINSHYYDINAIDTALTSKVNYSDLVDFYTKSEVDAQLLLKVNSSVLNSYYNKTEVDTQISTSLNNYYTKTQVDTLLSNVSGGNVDLSSYYTKPQVDTLLTPKITIDDVNYALTSYYNKTQIDSMLSSSGGNSPTGMSLYPQPILYNTQNLNTAHNTLAFGTYFYPGALIKQPDNKYRIRLLASGNYPLNGMSVKLLIQSSGSTFNHYKTIPITFNNSPNLNVSSNISIFQYYYSDQFVEPLLGDPTYVILVCFSSNSTTTTSFAFGNYNSSLTSGLNRYGTNTNGMAIVGTTGPGIGQFDIATGTFATGGNGTYGLSIVR